MRRWFLAKGGAWLLFGWVRGRLRCAFAWAAFLRLLCSCGGLCLLRRAEAGSRPAASHFLLLRQKKLTKEKATRVREALRAPLRYSRKRGLAKLASLRQRQP